LRTSGGFHPSALAPDPRARRASRAAGWVIVAVGLLGFAGWLLALPALRQPLVKFPPVGFASALGILALGTGVLGLADNHRRALAVGGGIGFLLGIVALLQRATGLNLGSGALTDPVAFLDVAAPLNIPVSNALLFEFGGAGLLAFVLPLRMDLRRTLAGAIGSIVVALCLGIAVTRLVGLVGLPGSTEGLLAGSSVHVLLASLLLGFDLVFVSWTADSTAATTPWVPLSIGLACLVTVLLMWRTMVTYEVHQAHEQTAAVAGTALREIARQVETATRGLVRIARFSPEPRPASPGWVASMLTLTHDIDGLKGIGWADRSAVIRDYRPTPIPSDTFEMNIPRRLASLAARSDSGPLPEVSYLALGDSSRAFAAVVRICPLQGCTGYIVGVFDAERLLQPILVNRGDGYAFRVTSAGARLLGPRAGTRIPSAWAERSSFNIGDVTWQLVVWPTGESLMRFRTGLPDLLLMLGLFVTALLPVTVRLGQMTLTRARLTERVRLNLALETATDGIWEWDPQSGLATRSDTLWRHLGYPPTEIPETLDGWMALVHPDDARRVQDVLNEHLRGDRQTFEAEYRVRDHGGRWHWVIDRGRVVDRSAAGAPLRMLGISADVTARRSAEDALREVQSFTTMGRLAARVAHEVNNPLAGIQNAFTLIKDAVPLDHPHRPYVGAIEREIGRIAGVTRQLYETYRQEQSGEGEASVASAVGDAVALLEQLNRESKVRIVVDLAGAPAVVHFPDALLRQAVYNLVQNAVEVSPPGGRIDVTATLDDGCFVLRVADQGPGIPPESRDRVFEPFFSTKPATLKTGGMGLGLSMVRQSVRAFGGRVDIVDLNGKGSEFVVRLPLHSSESGVPA